MRVIVVLDMEGICGITDYRQCGQPFTEYWDSGRHHITADVNALGAALLQAGADEVHVYDSHAYLKNVIREDVMPGITVHDPFYVWHRLLHRQPGDCVYLCGLHAHAGAPGFMPHTIAPGLKLRVNGRPIGEVPWVVWGLAGLPVIGASGDGGFADSVREQLPGLPATVVKDTVSRTTAAGDIALGRRELAAAAAAGLKNMDRAPRYEAPQNFTLELSCPTPAGAAAVTESVGGQRASERVVEVQLADWGEAINFIGRSMAPLSRHGIFAKALAATPAGADMAAAARAGVAPWLALHQEAWANWMETPEPEWAL